MKDLPTIRAEAIRTDVQFYWTGKPCRNGHVAERRASDDRCVSCERAAYRRRLGAHEEGTEGFYAEESVRWRARRKPEYDARRRADRCKTAQLRKDRTNPWASHAEREAMARLCAEAKAEGVEPDHIIAFLPLRGRIAGLHTLANIRKISRRANYKKGKRLELSEAEQAAEVEAGRAVWREDAPRGKPVKWQKYVSDKLAPLLTLARRVLPQIWTASEMIKAAESDAELARQVCHFCGRLDARRLCHFLKRIAGLKSGGLKLKLIRDGKAISWRVTR